jgi:NTE family protein
MALKIKSRKKLGLALGSGSARGWSHIGVLQALADLDMAPDVICGSSIGALVGAFSLKGQLAELAEWTMDLNTRDIIQFMDINVITRGGLVEGSRLVEFLRGRLGEVVIEDLPGRFGAVATNLKTGREVWLTQGSLVHAVRASISLPAIFTPVRHEGDWLVDGGLVNPIPISLCHALGAEAVIAVNLNGDVVGKHFREARDRASDALSPETGPDTIPPPGLWERTTIFFGHLFEPDQTPGLLDVLAGSINIMQDRITRSRMAGDPPDVLLSPRLAHLGLLEFHRAAEAIEEGRAAVTRSVSALEYLRDSL